MTDRVEPIGEVFCKGSISLGSGCKRCGRCAIELTASLADAQAEIARLRGALEAALNETTEGNVAGILEDALK